MMIKRLTTAVIGAVFLLGVGAGYASASPEDGARDAAATATTNGDLAGFFVRMDEHQGLRGQRAAAKAPQLVGDVQRIHTLNPEFVKGTAGAQPGVFSHLAVRADSASGQHASVWLAQAGDGWAIQNISNAIEDVTFTAQGAGAFNEPQIGAWYRLDGERIVALNDAARGAIGSEMTVGAYQERVHRLYGDKLPGSEYAKSGALGGYPGPAPAAVEQGKGDSTAALAIAMLLLGGGLAGYRLRHRLVR
ncbi:hypothetical protein D5S17_13515 [Pseudonocardiaceae bacterium YIM PH 21723]|nr:hypothetical protein D5S17_13515 [Pseudonocardiaceae bacterium YIM PH 21723]